jgi:hypothetical protein
MFMLFVPLLMQLQVDKTQVKEFLLQPSERLSQQDERINSCLVDLKSAHASIALTCSKCIHYLRDYIYRTLLNIVFKVTQLFSKGLFSIKDYSEESEEESEKKTEEDTNENPITNPNCSLMDHTNEDDTEGELSVRDSPLYYAVVHWLLHASEVAPGKHATPYSEDLWKAVERWFWESGTAIPSTAFQKWFQIFPGPRKEVLHPDPLYMFYKLSGCDPLHIAASYGFTDIIEYAHLVGLDFNVQESHKKTPLCYVAMGGRKAVAKVLIDKGVDVNRPSDIGMTPLLLAVYNELEEMTETLLCADGIDLDYLDDDGSSALGYAVKNGLKKTVELLKQRGAAVCKFDGKDLELK